MLAEKEMCTSEIVLMRVPEDLTNVCNFKRKHTLRSMKCALNSCGCVIQLGKGQFQENELVQRPTIHAT